MNSVKSFLVFFICVLSALQTFSQTIVPVFRPIAPLCQFSASSSLPTTSLNSITGSWNPIDLNTAVTTSYTFTPDPGQNASQITISVEIITVTPTFDPVTFCLNDPLAELPTVSKEGIPGSFSQTLDTSTPGTTPYTFISEATYNPFFCSNIGSTISVTILSNQAPTFDQIPPICNGNTLPVLPLTSKNGITGTWNPAVIDDTQTTTYTFTSTDGTCSTEMTIEIGQKIPTFTGTNAVPTRVGFNSITTLGFPTTSNEGYTGVWSLNILNSLINEYTFTSDDLNQCVRSVSFYVLTSYINPFFIPRGPFCEGDTVMLPAQSDDETPLTGVWTPSTIDTSTPGTTSYLFTPDDFTFSPVSIDFTVHPLPTATPPAAGIALCDDDADGLVSGFDLTTKSSEILGGQGLGY